MYEKFHCHVSSYKPALTVPWWPCPLSLVSSRISLVHPICPFLLDVNSNHLNCHVLVHCFCNAITLVVSVLTLTDFEFQPLS